MTQTIRAALAIVSMFALALPASVAQYSAPQFRVPTSDPNTDQFCDLKPSTLVPACSRQINKTTGAVTALPSLLPSFTVPNNAALQALPVTTMPAGYSVGRLGFASAGDGGHQSYTFVSSACSAPDNGAQVAPAIGTGCWVAANGTMSVQAWGADRTGANAAATTAALTAAFNQGTAHHITIPCGNYVVSGVVTVAANSPQVEGMGEFCVTITSTSPTADIIHINPGVLAYHFSDFTVNRTATPTAGAGIDVEAGGYGSIERVLSQNNWYGFRLGPTSRAYCNLCQAQYNFMDGFLFFNSAAAINVQWIMGHPLSQQNEGWGFYLNWTGNGSLDDTDPYFLFPNTYANTKGGYAFDGAAYSAGPPATGAAHNDLTMLGPIASSDNGNGFEFIRPGLNISITNIFSELAGQVASGRTGAVAPTHIGNGLNFDTGGAPNSDVVISGGSLVNNSFAGLQTYSNSALARLAVSGIDAHDNGQAGSNSAGFFLQSHATATVLSGVLGHNQQVGLYMADSTVVGNTAVSGAILTGNTTAGCNTPITNKAGVLGSGC